MSNRQLILVAIDHATNVERTMDVALSTAKVWGADVHVIQVVPRRPFGPHDDRGVDFGARVASTLRSAGAGEVRVRSLTLRGEPDRVISAYAQLQQAALLVVERDYGSSRLWRNARVVDDVARQSPAPLLVLPNRQMTEHRPNRLRRIVTPVDFSVASAMALRTAVDLSRRHGARIALVHTLKEIPPHMVFSGGEAWEVARRLPGRVEAVAKRLRRMAGAFGAGDVDAEVATGVAGSAILEIAARSDVDLVVMGIAHRSWLDRLMFGSTLRRVLRRASVPVLVVPVVAGARAWPDDAVVGRVTRLDAESAVDRRAA